MSWSAIGIVCLALAAGPGRVGTFTAKSGDGKVLDRERIRGKVVLAFYEGDGEQEANAALKAELKKFAETELVHRDRLMVVGFGDVSGIIWPFTAVARSKLADISKELGVTIWGDWDGSVREAFGFTEGSPNVMVLDDKGVIRLSAAGKVPLADYQKIKKLMKTLVDGAPAP